jgi:NAD(P)-dependent dehydrogenase (short-subunit alcohol dehydrogenase family)
MGNRKWSLTKISDQSGKVVIVTGGNSGLGFESVKAFAHKGADVVLACRSVKKGVVAKDEILRSFPEANINVMTIDLMDLSSVRSFAESFKEKYNRLDILINNAGIMMNPYAITKDGFESQLGTNHLGHFALTGLLIDLIINTPNSRVVSVSSLAHKQFRLNFDDFLFEDGKGYNPMKAYSHSKLANLLFTYQLQRLFEKNNIQSFAVAAHPGASYTNLGRFLEHKLLARVLRPLIVKVLPSPASGALPQIRAAVDSSVKGGDYLGPSGFMELAGSPVLVKSSKASRSIADAQRLWEISEKITGIKYRFQKMA